MEEQRNKNVNDKPGSYKRLHTAYNYQCGADGGFYKGVNSPLNSFLCKTEVRSNMDIMVRDTNKAYQDFIKNK